MRIITLRRFLVGLTVLFLLPLAAHAVIHSLREQPANWRTANWESVGMLPDASADRDARFLVFTGRTGRWKGIFSVHSWVVFKPAGATAWSRYDVVGWGNPVRMNGWAPDGRWYGDVPRVLVDLKGAAAEALIPKVRSAIKDYRYRNHGDYRMWPGPNSNTFIAAVLRAVPELATDAAAERRRQGFPRRLLCRLDRQPHRRRAVDVRRARHQGSAGSKASSSTCSGWSPASTCGIPPLKLPGFGRIGIDDGTAIAAPAMAR